uniref:Uncharacterized protein n=1 Tax=Anguilla anguilla TaxID=7936 RepID=A0A0E9WQ43_ANGAN
MMQQIGMFWLSTAGPLEPRWIFTNVRRGLQKICGKSQGRSHNSNTQSTTC